MPSESTNQTSLDPLAPLAEMLAWLTSTTLHLLIGIAVGLVLASVMRHRHLRWTWSASALPLLVLTRSVFAGWSATLLTAALCAAVRGRRWQHKDELAGRDLAEVAAERRGPLDALRSLMSAATSFLGPGEMGDCLRGGRLIVAREQSSKLVSIPFGGRAGGTHTLVVGAAGSGKTVTQAWMLARAVEHGMGAVVLDPKRDSALRERLEHAAREAGRRFIEWTPDGPSVYNPFLTGSPGEIVDKLLAGERFSEPHYQRQAQRYLGHVVRALRAAEQEISLDALVRRLDPARLEVLVRDLPEDRAQATHEYLDSLTPRQHSDLSGVRDRLAILAESDFAPWLDPRTEDAESFHVLDALEQRAVVYFSLESDRRPLLAHMLSVAVVLDLQTAIAALQTRPVSSVVAIDEFSAIATEQVTRLFARARSAGISLVLGTQELADLRVPGREAVLDQVLGNISALIAHRQVTPESAETISKLAGSIGGWSTSHHSDGRHTRTRQRVPVLQPDSTRALAPGWAVVVTFGGSRSAHVARILTNDDPPASERNGESRFAHIARIVTNDDPPASDRSGESRSAHIARVLAKRDLSLSKKNKSPETT
jgi:hypothetical protein